METIRCVVERITYRNPENGYCVLKVSVKEINGLVTLVGSLIDVSVGTILSVEGQWQTDSRYGEQFRAEAWEEVMPATLYGIEKYLGSGLIKGVGPGFAKRIVAKFGLDTIDVIENTPDRLKEVGGLGKGRIEKIVESWEKQREVKNIMLFLQGHGVSTAFAAKIYQHYGKEAIHRVRENPYRLADDIWGIGFKTADSIAESLGFSHEDPFRCRSGIIYTLNTLSEEGHVFAEREQLLSRAEELLEASAGAVEQALEELRKTESLVCDGDAIYLPMYYRAEAESARMLAEIQRGETPYSNPPQVNFDALSRDTGVEYDELQQQAIQQAVSSKVMVLTGGPGTGKTTTTLGIIKVLESLGFRLLLAAPTGRAAKRMTETTGREAKTMHRLLEFQPGAGYRRNRERPLEGHALILDECSMVDGMLLYDLLCAVPAHMKIIFVGDIDQLPSVGAGNVLRDIIDSGCFPVIRLTRIFRQAQESRIIMNAHRINEGKMPSLDNAKGTDFFFIEQEDPELAAKEIVSLVKDRLPGFTGMVPSAIQVLTPMQKGVIGAANLNARLQEALNPSEEFLFRGGRTYRRKDKVMQIRNNYDKDVFNGDIGEVLALRPEERTLLVDFDGHIVEYETMELDELVPAYAITIHKSQGSEYPVVVIPMLMSHYVMLQRNLLYTGITRAKKLLVLVGSRKAIGFAVRNLTVLKRNSRLKERIRTALAGETDR